MMKDRGVIVACRKNFRVQPSVYFFFALLSLVICGSYKTALPDKILVAGMHAIQHPAII
jgi:hypothetical protein